MRYDSDKLTVDRMLKEQIGQMLFMGYRGTDATQLNPILDAIRRRQLGGVILFASNIKNPEQLAALTHALHREAKAVGIDPFFVSIDYEGGTVLRLQEKDGFPKTLTPAQIGSLSDTDIKKHAESMAKTLKSVGINLNFAPSLDVNVNPNNPIIGLRERSFSSDAKRVAECAAIFTEAFLLEGITPTYKHFPGHGSSMHDSHLGFVDVTHTFQACELEPYQKLLPIFSNQVCVMMSHVVHRGFDPAGYPASLSETILQNILRRQLQFSGVVVSDDMQMKAIVDHYGLNDALCLAINAGVDKLIFGNQLVEKPQTAEGIVNIIYDEVKAGRISEKKIEAAYMRAKNTQQPISVR